MSRQWVMIRGMMSESFHWWDFLPRLRDAFPDDEFHTPDLLGTGRSGLERTPTSLVRNVNAIRQQVPGNGRKIIFGFSLGGIIGLEWAYLNPHEVEALVLINISLANSPLHHRMRPGALRKIARFSLVRPGVRRDELSLGMTTALPLERCRELAPHWAKRAEEYPVHPMNFFAQIRLAGSARLRPTPPPVPILMLASGQDQVVHPECSGRIARAWNVPLHLHPEAGHDLSLEQPDWIVERLRNWSVLNQTVKGIVHPGRNGQDDSVNP